MAREPQHDVEMKSASNDLPAATVEKRAGERLLIVSGDRFYRDRLAVLLSRNELTCLTASGVGEALDKAMAARPDAAIVCEHLPNGCGMQLAKELTRRFPAMSVVLSTGSPTIDTTVKAMRSGAVDVVRFDLDTGELRARTEEALGRTRRLCERERRIIQLRGLCKQLNATREELTRHVGSLCDDLVGAYQELSDQMTRATSASEFKSMIRQELDIEGLLRTSLQFVLAKVGATNAAVFLPSTTGDYSLGAYVNYDRPKDSAEVMLDHLAAVIAPRFEEERDVVRVAGYEQLEERLGSEAHWIDGCELVVFTCRHDDETLAVVSLFRDERTPFDDDAMKLLEMIAGLWGAQLARVIHIHHRHVPKDQWGAFGEYDEGQDDYGLAA